jgi:hypothetical protein
VITPPSCILKCYLILSIVPRCTITSTTHQIDQACVNIDIFIRDQVNLDVSCTRMITYIYYPIYGTIFLLFCVLVSSNANCIKKKFFFSVKWRSEKDRQNQQRMLYGLSTDGSGVELLCPPPSSWCVMCIHGRKRSFPLDACGY